MPRRGRDGSPLRVPRGSAGDLGLQGLLLPHSGFRCPQQPVCRGGQHRSEGVKSQQRSPGGRGPVTARVHALLLPVRNLPPLRSLRSEFASFLSVFPRCQASWLSLFPSCLRWQLLGCLFQVAIRMGNVAVLGLSSGGLNMPLLQAEWVQDCTPRA